MWRVAPLLLGLKIILALVSSQFGLAQAWISGLIVDTAVRTVEAHGSLSAFLFPLALQFALSVTRNGSSWAGNVVSTAWWRGALTKVEVDVLGHVARLDPGDLEDSRQQDVLQSVQFRAGSVIALPSSIIDSGKEFLGIAVSLGVLLAFDWRVAAVAVVAVVPTLVPHFAAGTTSVKLELNRAPEERERHYFSRLFTIPAAAHEMRVYGLSDYLKRRYAYLSGRVGALERQMTGARDRAGFITTLVTGLAYAAAVAMVVQRAIKGDITVGRLTVYMALITQAQGQLSSSINYLHQLWEFVLWVSQYREAIGTKPTISWPADGPGLVGRVPRVGRGESAVAGSPPTGPTIEFQGVGFQYRGAHSKALDGVNLTIRGGQRVTLVGENGAGKSTLVKLLLRLYDPTEGRILVNGRDLKEYNLERYWADVAYLGQDYVRYELTARENVGFGRLEAMNDADRLLAAAQASGIREKIDSLPKGFDTRLGTMFKDGRQLSLGEWQRLALARVYLRGAPLVILDEPTSSLDPRQEAEILEHSMDLAVGRTTIFVSHRMATARMADLVVVLDKGKVAEVGTHDALMGAGGLYRTLFETQAKWYSESASAH